MEVIRYYLLLLGISEMRGKKGKKRKSRLLFRVEKLFHFFFQCRRDGSWIRYSVLWKTPSVDRTATYRTGQKNCSLFPGLKTLKAYEIKIHRRAGGYSISPLWHAIFVLHPVCVDAARCHHPGNRACLALPARSRDETINVVLITQKYQPYQRSTASFTRINGYTEHSLSRQIFLFPLFYPLVIAEKSGDPNPSLPPFFYFARKDERNGRKIKRIKKKKKKRNENPAKWLFKFTTIAWIQLLVSAGRNSTRTPWISFVQPSNQATTVILCPGPCNLETRKNKPGHVTPRPNDIPPRKPFSSFLCLFFVPRISRFLLIFFHFSTPFQRSSREKLYFVTGHERYYNKRANVFFTQFHSTLSFSHYWTLGKLKLKNFTKLYYTCWERTVTLLQGTGKIHHFDSNFELEW